MLSVDNGVSPDNESSYARMIDLWFFFCLVWSCGKCFVRHKPSLFREAILWKHARVLVRKCTTTKRSLFSEPDCMRLGLKSQILRCCSSCLCVCSVKLGIFLSSSPCVHVYRVDPETFEKQPYSSFVAAFLSEHFPGATNSCFERGPCHMFAV